MSPSTNSGPNAARSLFFLGQQGARRVAYPLMASQRPHLAYYGTTRSGKTFAIEYALRQLALSRRAGFCYVDPHGSSYWRMASFLRQHDITDRVLFWDINDPEYVVTYDPFTAPGQSAAYIAGNLTSALLSTLGKQATASEQPHLKTTTESGLLALLRLGIPFLLTRDLFDPQETAIKQAVARRLEHSTMLGAIAELPRLLDRYHELAAPYRRLENLFRDDRLRLTFTTAGVDFKVLMDEGWIVLVNAEPKDQDDEAATLFTRLLIKSLFMAAKRRPKADDTKPFFLAIDEASRYLTADTARILSETAGYGLYLLLGMQSIEQARLESEESYVAMRANINAEVVMRLSDFDESIYFAKRFFGHHMNLKAVKDQQFETAAIPRVVSRTTTSHVTGTVSGSSYSTRSEDGERLTDTESSTDIDQTTETEGWGVEYDYQKRRQTEYWQLDEQERYYARRFYLRREGETQRFGVARVNDERPGNIEIPQLSRPLYSQEEMVEWLRVFKASQPATLPLIEASRRFDETRSAQIEALRTTEEPVSTKRRQKKSTTQHTWK